MSGRIVILPPAGTGDRVHTDGFTLGLAHSDMYVMEFLRRAGLPDAELLLDDLEWAEWCDGRPHDYGGPPSALLEGAGARVLSTATRLDVTLRLATDRLGP